MWYYKLWSLIPIYTFESLIQGVLGSIPRSHWPAGPHQKYMCIQVVEFQECSAHARHHATVMCLDTEIETYNIWHHVHTHLIVNLRTTNQKSLENYEAEKLPATFTVTLMSERMTAGLSSVLWVALTICKGNWTRLNYNHMNYIREGTIKGRLRVYHTKQVLLHHPRAEFHGFAIYS